MTTPQVATAPTPAPPNPALHELTLLVRSRYGLVTVESTEEPRVVALAVAAARALQRQLYTWSLSQGLEVYGAQPGTQSPEAQSTRSAQEALRVIKQTAQGGIYLLLDMRSEFKDPIVQRLVREICQEGKATMFLTGEGDPLPESLRTLSTTFKLPRPDHALIESRVRALIGQFAARGRTVNELSEPDIQRLATALRGLTLDEVDQVFYRLVEEDGKLGLDDLPRALEAKSEALAESGVAELVGCEYGMDWVAGFTNLKQWVQLRAKAFAPEAEQFGLQPPRGVLLTGVPGCGKSFVVKAMAHDWNMPLLRLDASALYDKFVGATERNLRTAMDVAGALAPSILWIDEIEKGFASTGPSEADGGLTYRLVGMLATWMQERPAPVFVAATSNDITKLPPELTRQGRFDEIFFVDLPDATERQHLFSIQLARRGRDYKLFDLGALAEASDGFSGSEIEQAISNAMYASFGSGTELSTESIVTELGNTRPLSRVSPQVVANIRAWGKDHARSA